MISRKVGIPRQQHTQLSTCFFTVLSLGVILLATIPQGDCRAQSTQDAALPDGKCIWLEAEHFEETGGWKLDTQAVDQMGSPFLLAVGIGTPVEEATTDVTVSEGGKYRLWVRTRDWLPEYHPGRFRVRLDGKVVDHTFGQTGRSGWRWETGGTVRLEEGALSVELRDETGYYARCDALMLTQDLDWKPPLETEKIGRLRQIYGGVSRERQESTHDVVVVGGGLAGCTAAVAAARNGASVALVQNRPVLGGNASTELLIPPVGRWPNRNEHPLDPRETGLIEEYKAGGNQKVAEGKLYSQRLKRFVSQEPNIALHLNTHATGVEMAKGKGSEIEAVLAQDVRSGKRWRFHGTMVIDCTGDGVIGMAAGADHRYGKESKQKHNEPYAPEEPNDYTMGNGLKFYAEKYDSPQPFEAPEWAISFPSCSNFKAGHPQLTTNQEIGGQWRYELGGWLNTYRDAEEIRDDLLRLTFGLWDHIKNHCEQYEEKAKNYRLTWLTHIAGKRESYRLMGDHVLTQNDIVSQTKFPDRVAFGGWSLDDHHPAGFFHYATSPDYQPPEAVLNAPYPADRSKNRYRGQIYSIPYRSLYSRNINNLLMAGRDISASHMGLTNTRVMHTCAILGHAVGTASGMCVNRDESPRGIYKNDMEDLQQQLLKEGAHSVDMAYEDADNLASKAECTASSEGSYRGEPMPAQNVVDGFSRLDQDHPHAWLPADDASGVQEVELRWDQPVSFNMVHVYFQTTELAPSRFSLQVWKNGEWETIKEVKNNRRRRHVLGLEDVTTRRLRVVESESRGICAVRVYNAPQRRVRSARRAHRTMRKPDHGPFLPWKKREVEADFAGVLVDIPGSGQNYQSEGRWEFSSHTKPYIGSGYVHDGNKAKGDKSLEFTLYAPKEGKYELRLAYTAAPNRAEQTPVRVKTPRSNETITVNQRETPPIENHFYPLTRLELQKDEKVTVKVSNAETEGYVSVDAVQLKPVD